MNQADLTLVGQIAELINQYGAVLIIMIISVMFNVFILIQFLRGAIVPQSIYKKAVNEADRLQETMERERGEYMAKLLQFMGGLKQDTEKGDKNV